MLHLDLHSAAYILNPRYRPATSTTLVALQCSNTMRCCRSGYQRRTCTLTCKAKFRSFKKKADILSTQTLWSDKALEVGAHVWSAATCACLGGS